MTHSINTVRAFLQLQRESDEPDEILAILKTQDGKQLTKRILAKLPGGEARWRLSQFATMTHLETRDYGRTGGNAGIHLLIAYQTTNVTIDAAQIEEKNPGYFAGRRARNASRDALADDTGRLNNMANTLNVYEHAKAQLDEAKDNLDALIQHGAPFAAECNAHRRKGAA
ncbi:MAG TPA: hypothetical protein VII50_00445 [Acidothermaceae bacterium]